MSFPFHSILLGTSLAATIAVGLASAAVYKPSVEVAPKSDRLSFGASDVGVEYMTVETQRDGMSVLSRLTLGDTN
jgi:hypothetical protein